MKHNMFFMLAIAIFCSVFFSCSKDEDDPVAHLNNVMAEAISMNDLYEICHFNTWAQTGAYIEPKGYKGGTGNLNKEWYKVADYQCLKHYNVDSLMVTFVLNTACWDYFSGHATFSIYYINDIIASKLINTRMSEMKKLLENETVQKVLVKVGSSTSEYYMWNTAESAFLSSWDPKRDVYGFQCTFKVYTEDHIYYIITHSKGERDLGRGFNIRYGIGNIDEM